MQYTNKYDKEIYTNIWIAKIEMEGMEFHSGSSFIRSSWKYMLTKKNIQDVIKLIKTQLQF